MRTGIFILLMFFSAVCSAQSAYLPLNSDFNDPYERFLNLKTSAVHTALKPYISSDLGGLKDSVKQYQQISRFNKRDTSENVNESHITVSPAFVLEPGFSLTELRPVFDIAGGLHLNGNFKKSLGWNAVWLAGRSSFVNYIDSFVTPSHTVPGMGYAYKNGASYDFQYIAGHVSWSPNRFFNFSAGRDKHFWGDGHRSLFLSDVANAYPFAKVTARVWRLKYAVMYAMHQDLTRYDGSRSSAKNKFATFHYLSWNIWDRLQIGLFEAVVWQGSDTSRTRSYDINYMNPVIFFRPVEYSLGSADNALIGASFKVKVAVKQQFYGQVILDEFFLKEILSRSKWWANKQGIQLGFRSFDLFKVKGLDLRMEVNAVRPYTYSHGSVQQNYGHFNIPLAHPLGANFGEFITMVDYRKNNWLFQGKVAYNLVGMDTAGTNYGGNIFKPYSTYVHEFGNYIGQGSKVKRFFAGARAAWLISANGNIEANAGVTLRAELHPEKNLYTAFFYAGIRTALWNQYRDY